MTALEAIITQILELSGFESSVGVWFSRGKGDGFTAMLVGEEDELLWKSSGGCLESRGDTVEEAVLNLFNDYVAIREAAANPNPEPPKKKRGRPRKDRSA